MTGGLVIHVRHGEDTRTAVFTDDRIHIGHDATCDLCLPSDSSILTPVELELTRTGNHYRVAHVAPDSVLTLNDAPLQMGTTILSNDELRVPGADLSLRFFPAETSGALSGSHRRDEVAATTGGLSAANTNLHVAPFIEHAALEAAATARRDDAKVFLREFTRELVREISPLTKIVTLLILSTLVGGIIYFVSAAKQEIERTRRENEALTRELTRINERFGTTSERISQLDESTRSVVGILSNAPNIVAKYSAGVCLIAGTYQWYDTTTNRPLRHPQSGVDEDGVPQPATAEGEDAALTPDGQGQIAQFDFVGTGFHVGGGYIITNRHVASRPWEADPRSQFLTGTTPARARIVRLQAFFPNIRQPLTLRVRAVSSAEDLAVGTVDRTAIENLPVLPLDTDIKSNDIGNEVVMIGFPSGPDRLLALLDEPQSRSAQARYTTLESLIGYLASQKLIRPLTTRGTITDLLPRRIVYDARTAEGGSGAPLFGQTGRVIGVNFAVLPSNSASNFAVPISFARDVLARAGWRPPEATPPDQNQGAEPGTTVLSSESTPRANAQSSAPAR